MITEIESTIPLTDEQRVKVVELIIESGPPPRRFGQLDFYYVLYRASQIPEAKWRQLLDESEYKALGKLLQQGKQMELQVKSQEVTADAELSQAEIQYKYAELGVKNAELNLKEQELLLRAQGRWDELIGDT